MRLYEITRRWLLKGAGAASIAAADPTGTLTKIATNLVQLAPASKQSILAELLGTIKPRDLYQIWWGYGEYASTEDFITPSESNKMEKLFGPRWWEELLERSQKEKKEPIKLVQELIGEPTTFSRVTDILKKHGLDTRNWEEIRDWFFDDVIDKQFYDFWNKYKKTIKYEPALHDSGPQGYLEPATNEIPKTAAHPDELVQNLNSKLSKLKGRVLTTAKYAIRSLLTKGLSNKLSKKQLEDIATGNFDMKRIAPQQVTSYHALEYKPEVYTMWFDKLQKDPKEYDPIVVDTKNNILSGAEQLEALKILDLPADAYVVSYDNKDTK